MRRISGESQDTNLSWAFSFCSSAAVQRVKNFLFWAILWTRSRISGIADQHFSKTNNLLKWPQSYGSCVFFSFLALVANYPANNFWKHCPVCSKNNNRNEQTTLSSEQKKNYIFENISWQKGSKLMSKITHVFVNCYRVDFLVKHLRLSLNLLKKKKKKKKLNIGRF